MFSSLTSSVNPCKVSYVIQVHRVVSEVNGTFIKMLPLVASPSTCRQVDVPLLLSWLQHRSHHQVISDQELGVDLIGCLVVIGDPPEGPNDWVSCIKNLTCQFKNPWGHQGLMELCELLCYLYHLKMNAQRYSVTITVDIRPNYSQTKLNFNTLELPSVRIKNRHVYTAIIFLQAKMKTPLCFQQTYIFLSCIQT